MKTPTKYRSLSISLPEDLVAKIDSAAKKQYKSRSDIIRESILMRVIPAYTATKTEEKAIKRSHEAYARGEFITLKDLEHELGMGR